MSLLTPIAYAQSHTAAAESFVSKINDAIINPLILLLFGLALIYFLWGMFTLIRNADSDEGRETGRRHVLWGIVGMVIMLSVWAILQIATVTFGIDPPESSHSSFESSYNPSIFDSSSRYGFDTIDGYIPTGTITNSEIVVNVIRYEEFFIIVDGDNLEIAEGANEQLCAEDHWHPVDPDGAISTVGIVVEDPSPDGCGYGTLSEKPVLQLRIEESQSFLDFLFDLISI